MSADQVIDMREDSADAAATPTPSPPAPASQQPPAAAAGPPNCRQLYADVSALGIGEHPLPISAPTMKQFTRIVSQFTKQLMAVHAEQPYQLYTIVNQQLIATSATHLERATLLELLYHVTVQYKQLSKDTPAIATQQNQFNTYLEANLYRIMMLVVPHSVDAELNHSIAARIVRLWQKHDLLKKHTLLNMRKMVDTWQAPTADEASREGSQGDGHRSVLHDDDMQSSNGNELFNSANKRKRPPTDRQTQPPAKRYDYRRSAQHAAPAQVSMPQRAPPAPLTEHDHEVIRYIEQLRQQQKKRHLEISLRPEKEEPLDECKEVWDNLLSQPLVSHPDFLQWWMHPREWQPAAGCIPREPPRDRNGDTTDNSMYTPNYDDLSPVVEPIDDGERNRKLQQAPASRQPPPRPNRAPSYSISDDNIHARY